MKKLFFVLIISFLLGCSNSPQSMIEHLDGYWEIDAVTLPDGSKRDFSFNGTVDFIKITDSLTGIRKKMKPNLDGTYTTTEDEEHLKIVIENDSLNLYYKTPYAEWKETVLDATEDKLLILNKDKIHYLYKRYEPIDIE